MNLVFVDVVAWILLLVFSFLFVFKKLSEIGYRANKLEMLVDQFRGCEKIWPHQLRDFLIASVAFAWLLSRWLS